MKKFFSLLWSVSFILVSLGWETRAQQPIHIPCPHRPQTCPDSHEQCPYVCLPAGPRLDDLNITSGSVQNYQTLVLNSDGVDERKNDDYDCTYYGLTGLMTVQEWSNDCYGTVPPGTVFLFPGTYCATPEAYQGSPRINCTSPAPTHNPGRDPDQPTLHQQTCDLLGVPCENFIGFGLYYPFYGESASGQNNLGYVSGTCNPRWFGCCDQAHRCREIPENCEGVPWRKYVSDVLEKHFAVSMEDAFFRRKVAAGHYPDVSVNSRNVILMTWASTTNSDLYYQVGVPEGETSWSFGARRKYANGERSAVALNDAGVAVEAHGTGGGKLFCRVGGVDAAAKTVAWGKRAEFGAGRRPRIALNNQNIVTAVWRSGDSAGTDLYCKVGRVDPKSRTIDWGKTDRYSSGTLNNISLNDQGMVAAAHASATSTELFYMLGSVTDRPVAKASPGEKGPKPVPGKGLRINWLPAQAYDQGKSSTIAIDDFGNVAELRMSGGSRLNLFWRLGYIDTSSATWKIVWTWHSKGKFDNGRQSVVALPLTDPGLSEGGLSTLGRQRPIVIIKQDAKGNGLRVSAYRDADL